MGRARPPQGTLAIKAAKGSKYVVSSKIGSRCGSAGTAELKWTAKRYQR